MSGSGLDDIRRPLRRYNLARRGDFGSFRSRRNRDRRLAIELARTAEQTDSPELAAQLATLAYRLGYADRGERAPPSRASYVWQRRVRRQVGSDVFRLAQRAVRQRKQLSFATLAFRGGGIRPEDLLAVDPRRWAKQLKTGLDRARSRLNRSGSGWSIWFLDCDYLQVEDVFLFHWHGFAAGSEIAAIDELRKSRKYQSPRHQPGIQRDGVRFRIRRTHQPLRNLGYLCLYLLKEQWPSQPRARNVPGNRDRSHSRPLPRHLRPLERLFFDRWSIRDISAVRGLRVIDGQLEVRQ